MMQPVAHATERFCDSYWAAFSTKTIEQDPNTMASFYKESGHN